MRVEPASLLARVLGRTEVTVRSLHHQAVDEAGSGLRAVAWAPDGTPEAYEDPAAPFVLGVQWHPETGDGPALFLGLVAAAGGR